SFFFCQTHSVPRQRQLHMESRPLVLAAAYADAAMMIADNGLRYCQSQPRSMLLAGVIRREDALALLWSEPFAGICEFKDGKLVILGRAEGELTAIRHGINGVQHQILHDPSQQHRIGADGRYLSKLHVRLNLAGPLRELTLKKLYHCP